MRSYEEEGFYGGELAMRWKRRSYEEGKES